MTISWNVEREIIYTVIQYYRNSHGEITDEKLLENIRMQRTKKNIQLIIKYLLK
jgi:hypothetical protein